MAAIADLPLRPAALRRILVTPAQCRAARAWLGWTQARLAGEAHVARKTIADFELEHRSLHKRTRAQITSVLCDAGAGLMSEDSLGGEGVRFHPNTPTAVSESRPSS